ncbi:MULTISPECIES: DNA-processing protein DprA [Pacificibacter]|uniref:DNA-processing protein DprA n=1 Tax=Pacificibacter TaxID=1042323 RepID=UPI001C08D470|nr:MULTISPECIES: DNA-processing protein DprA [Pacificibacter]MBU2937086.1 DNA-processing protein DprA [Pacificibacter marinus]MDO6616374.1 DNA-processing protein DprA [Pacificibacter sp. 1_MG-2023]
MDFIPSHHPLTPPHTAEDRAIWLRLLRSRRVGVSTFYRLMNDHGCAAAALTALPEIAREAGVSGYQTCPMAVVDKELKAGRKAGARLVAIGDTDYPAALALTPDAPPLLWVKGDLSLFERPMIALVGARNASSLGLRMARALSRDLGDEGFGIVSGMARGIDAAVHEAALKTGTIAVLGGGLDVIYPAENKELYAKIANTGVVVSEQPMGMKPFARHFPMRNRIVSGMALATVVIEAAAKSGSLLTAGNAMEQGRDVMAVPGHPFDGRSSGCNNLLRDGASLVRGSRDVIDVLASASPLAITAMDTPEDALVPIEPEMRSFEDHATLHSEILSRLGGAAVAEDQLIRDIGARAEEVSSQIMTLELDGQILRKAGGLLARA